MLRVLTGGLQTTVQDLGRMGHQRQGVPVGGAMDRVALRVGNLLVGNDDDCASLEASLIGPSLTFEQRTLIALTGADLSATIGETLLPLWRPIAIAAGTTLRFGRPRVGCRAYLAIAGGVDVPRVFESRSTYLRAGFGGHQGRALRAGDLLGVGHPSRHAERLSQTIEPPSDRPAVAGWSISTSLRPRYSESPTVRVIPGAHTNLLTADARNALTSAALRVSSSSDRMGYRLEGVELGLRSPIELLSEGVAFGTIQLPPGGAPIVLMADAQTTGGYPRIGEVASVDLPLVAQLKPGDSVRFRFVTIGEAQRAYLEQEQDLAQARVAVALRHHHGAS
jgi:antagonist of KipI